MARCWWSASPSLLWRMVVLMTAAALLVTTCTESSSLPTIIITEEYRHPHRNTAGSTTTTTQHISSRWKPPVNTNVNDTKFQTNHAATTSQHNETNHTTHVKKSWDTSAVANHPHRHYHKSQFHWANFRSRNRSGDKNQTRECPPLPQRLKVDSDGNYGITSRRRRPPQKTQPQTKENHVNTNNHSMTTTATTTTTSAIRSITIPYQYQLESSPEEEEDLLLFEGEREALLTEVHRFIVEQGWLPFWFPSKPDNCHEARHGIRHVQLSSQRQRPPQPQQHSPIRQAFHDTRTVVGIQTHPHLHQMNVTQECWYQSTISGNPCHVISGQITLYLQQEEEEETTTVNATNHLNDKDPLITAEELVLSQQQQQQANDDPQPQRWTFPALHRLNHVLQDYNAYQERFQQTTNVSTFYNVHLTLLEMPHCTTPIHQTTLYDRTTHNNNGNHHHHLRRNLRQRRQQQTQTQAAVEERPILYGIQTVYEIPMKVHYQVETIHDIPPPSSNSSSGSAIRQQQQQQQQLQRLMVKFNRQLQALLVPLLFPQDCMTHHHHKDKKDVKANEDTVNSNHNANHVDPGVVMGLYYPMDHDSMGIINDGGTTTSSCPQPIMFVAEECILVEATFVMYVEDRSAIDVHDWNAVVTHGLVSSASSSLFEQLDDSIVRVTILNNNNNNNDSPQQQVTPTVASATTNTSNDHGAQDEFATNMTFHQTPVLVIQDENATTATFDNGRSKPTTTTMTSTTTTADDDMPDTIQTHAKEEHASSIKQKSDETQRVDSFPPPQAKNNNNNSPQRPLVKPYHTQHMDHIQALEAELIQELREGRKEVTVPESSSSSTTTAVVQGNNENGIWKEEEGTNADFHDGEETDWKSTVAKHAIVVVAVMASVILIDLFVMNRTHRHGQRFASSRHTNHHNDDDNVSHRNHRRVQPSYASLHNDDDDDDDDDDDRFQNERSWIDASMQHNSHDEEVPVLYPSRRQQVQIINGEALRVI